MFTQEGCLIHISLWQQILRGYCVQQLCLPFTGSIERERKRPICSSLIWGMRMFLVIGSFLQELLKGNLVLHLLEGYWWDEFWNERDSSQIIHPKPWPCCFYQLVSVLQSFCIPITLCTVCILLTFLRFILATLVALPFTPMSWSVTQSFELE